jgi:hypothetical protein
VKSLLETPIFGLAFLFYGKHADQAIGVPGIGRDAQFQISVSRFLL